MTRAEAYRLRAETELHMQQMIALNCDPRQPFAVRYEAIVLAEAAMQAMADLQEILRLCPEV